jgi:hypothetical protein
VGALNTLANSLAHPRAMLCPKRCKEGTIEAKTGRSRVANKLNLKRKPPQAHTLKKDVMHEVPPNP